MMTSRCLILLTSSLLAGMAALTVALRFGSGAEEYDLASAVQSDFRMVGESVRVSLESIMQGGSMTEWDYSVGAAHCVDGKKS